MISVIVYGRNDSHGYNLHKRAALSLNSIAEFLEDANDEIIFVDWNSSENLPSFPVAIADCLTDKCVAKLRILRVGPHIHKSLAHNKTHLPVLEPVARNVGIRRAVAQNSWILSTNTDVILDVKGESLNAIVQNLDLNYYASPRFELPEWIWESLPRSDPELARDTLRLLAGKSVPLNVVYSSPANLFDAPGDFQLLRREPLETIGGFDETMILGWHVDSNLALRMAKAFGDPGSLKDDVRVFHCNHTRQFTQYHIAHAPSNDLGKYCGPHVKPTARSGVSAWGLPNIHVPEMGILEHEERVKDLTQYLNAEGEEHFSSSLVDPGEQLGGVPVSVSLPFLLDNLVSNRYGAVLYLGMREDLRSRLQGACGVTKNEFLNAWEAADSSLRFTSLTVVLDLTPKQGLGSRRAITLPNLSQEDREGLTRTLWTFADFLTSSDWSLEQTNFLFVNVESNAFEASLAALFDLMPSQYYSRVRKAVPRSELRHSNTRLVLDVVTDTCAKLENLQVPGLGSVQVPSPLRRRMAALEDHHPRLARLLKAAARRSRRAFKKLSP